ncbi:MAG: YceI family protein [Balneolales bacterium]
MPVFSILIALMALTGFGFPKAGDLTVTLIAKQGSMIWIEGSTNVNDFHCDARIFHGIGLMKAGNITPAKRVKKNVLSIQAHIPIDGFECGKRRMNRDLYNALKGDRHPEISFEFLEAAIAGDSITVTGYLTVAGVVQIIVFDVKGYAQDDTDWRISGSASIFMNDYNIDPPSPLLGMIKVNDRLSVNFDFLVDVNHDLSEAYNHE